MQPIIYDENDKYTRKLDGEYLRYSKQLIGGTENIYNNLAISMLGDYKDARSR